MFRVTRRAFLIAASLLAPALRLRASPGSVAPATLDDFMALSARLVGVPKLDREIGAIYLAALNGDADQAGTLAYLVEVNGNPTPEMKALAATIIEWWYTGVYQVTGKDRLATHTGALIWSSMNMPAPGTCAGAFGAWANTPA